MTIEYPKMSSLSNAHAMETVNRLQQYIDLWPVHVPLDLVVNVHILVHDIKHIS